jgi:hypothetical protein
VPSLFIKLRRISGGISRWSSARGFDDHTASGFKHAQNMLRATIFACSRVKAFVFVASGVITLRSGNDVRDNFVTGSREALKTNSSSVCREGRRL